MAVLLGSSTSGARGAERSTVEANHVIQVQLQSSRTYENAFTNVDLDAIVSRPDGKELRVPGFWMGGDRWCFRYASDQTGKHTWRTVCTDTRNATLHGASGGIEVVKYDGDNPLYRHGPIRVASDHRHLEHADGTPFFWLGDTWWKCLCNRMTWEGFQKLTADRKAKGFSVVQIVCGPYPDEGHFEERWKNEGGFPYTAPGFERVNPEYFDYADRRIQCLVDAGIVPAIVGGWGRRDCDGMALAGLDGMKRHWRYLIARYGAYPTIWIVGGESKGPLWTETAKYVRATDCHDRPTTMHPASSARSSVADESSINFDMLQTGHGGWSREGRGTSNVIPALKAAYGRQPPMPVVIGEHSYEQHMQTGFADVQRHVFWSAMLSGASGLTYGAAGVWHAGVEGDPGLARVYDRTTWKEGMRFAGSTQLGYGKKLLEQYPWEKFEVHPEWTDPDSFAAGIPGQVRFIYTPNRGVYNWKGLQVKGLEPDVPYRMFYFDPVRGLRDDVGTVVNAANVQSKRFPGHTEPLVLEDRFDDADASKWTDHGSATRRENGRLVGGKQMATTFNDFNEANAMVSVDALSDAEAGIILRFHDPDNYVVGLYTPSLKCIYIHDRRNEQWGAPLGQAHVPKIGRNIRLTAAVSGRYAKLVLSDGKSEYQAPVVTLKNITPGRVGVWLYQIGERQEYDNFAVSGTLFMQPDAPGPENRMVAPGGDFTAPPVPSPQDWLLVLERVNEPKVNP